MSDERTTESPDAAEDLGGERGPVRTCVGCRERAPKSELVRLAIVPAELRGEGAAVVADVTGKLPGRGLHVHPTLACVKAAVERGGIARAVRGAPGVTSESLRAALGLRLSERIDGLLGGARRARKLAVGTDAVRAVLDTCAALIVADDALGRAAELGERVRARGVPVLAFGDKARLGALTRAQRADEVEREVGVVAILDPGIAAEVVRTLGRVAQLQVAGARSGEVSEAR